MITRRKAKQTLLVTTSVISLALLSASPASAHHRDTTGPGQVGGCAWGSVGTGPRLTDEVKTSLEDQVIDRVNAERRARGIAAIPATSCLSSAAAEHATDVIKYRAYDWRPPRNPHVIDGKGPAERLRQIGGLDFSASGENIACWGHTASFPVDIFTANSMNAWMNSIVHRNNILNRSWTHSGLGVADGVNDGVYYICAVQDFVTAR